MTLFIDIGHPAHVHYFKYLYKDLIKKNTVIITARNRDVIHELLEANNMSYHDRGKGSSSMLGKFFYLFSANFILLKYALKYKPDVFLSFASPYASHVAGILNKPNIVLDDTESARLNHILYKPFADVILTPNSFTKDMGSKHRRFEGFMELSYLHPKYFKPNKKVYDFLQIKENEKYAILRFVSWDANHDVNQTGLSVTMKNKVVQYLKEYMHVFISSEIGLPEELNRYKLDIPANMLHDALFFADLYVGEGATTASECAFLGTPAIYINSLNAGTLEIQSKNGLIVNLRNEENLLSELKKIVENNSENFSLAKNRENLISKSADINELIKTIIQDYAK